MNHLYADDGVLQKLDREGGRGKTKHDALELAKQTVRSHKEKGWDDPKYWAAFILLDALD